MKKTTSILSFAAALLFTLSSAAQSNYTIKMSMKMDGLPPEMASMGEMEMVTYIKGDKMKSERSGMMGSNITLFDGNKMTSLNENMGRKTGFIATRAEIEAVDQGEKTQKPKIEYTNEKKTIAGYECSKAIVTSLDKEKKERKSTIWYTDKVVYAHRSIAKSQGRGMLDLSDLKGYPLGMEMTDNRNGNEIKITMTTTDISTAPVADSVFDVSTEGYKMMTYKEMVEMQKSMANMGR